MIRRFKDKVDIVIVTWNSRRYLKTCLDSIEKYTKNVPHRTIVVNNGSTDGTNRYLNGVQSENTIILSNKTNLGFPKALMLGYKHTTSEVVCLMNDDVVTSPNWLYGLLSVFLDSPNIGMLGPLRPGANFVHPYTNKLSKTILEQSKKERKTPRGRINFFTMGKKYSTFVMDYKRANANKLLIFDSLPHIVSTCCVLVRREAIKKSGGIVDTRFIKYGGDDADLSWRLIHCGYKIAVSSESYIHHFEHVSMDAGSVDRQFYLKKNARKLFHKWKGEIKKYIKIQTRNHLTRRQILLDSWLLQRLANAVGKNFWK